MECDSSNTEMAVSKSYLRPAILYGNERWRVKECNMGILRKAERFIVRAMYEVQLKNRKRVKDFILKLGLNETVD